MGKCDNDRFLEIFASSDLEFCLNNSKLNDNVKDYE